MIIWDSFSFSNCYFISIHPTYCDKVRKYSLQVYRWPVSVSLNLCWTFD